MYCSKMHQVERKLKFIACRKLDWRKERNVPPEKSKERRDV
jgi:hypothetical protein